MSTRAPAFSATLAALPTQEARMRAGLRELHALFRDLVRAAAPPNPQFERERIIAQADNPRELVFLFGLLSEGENEAALLLELIDTIVCADPDAEVAHIVDELWYYLRTSIDEGWQLDDGAPCAAAALAYLFSICCERLDRLRNAPSPPVLLDIGPESAALLRSLREEFA